MWARSEWRNRWPALLLLTILIALGGGAAIAATAAAHRTDTAFERMLHHTNSPTLTVSGLTETELVDLDPMLLDRVMEIEGVLGASQEAFLAVSAVEYPNFFSVAVTHERGDALLPLYVEGPERDYMHDMAADEVLINESMSELLGVRVGGEMNLESATSEQFLASIGGDAELCEPQGPAITVQVIGIARLPEEVSDAPDPFLFFSQAFFDKYRDQMWTCRCVIAISTEPQQIDAVATELAAIYPDAIIERTEDLNDRLAATVALQSNAWTVMALTAVAAGLVTLLLGCGRLARALTLVDGSHRALGMTQRASQLGRLLIVAPTALLGTAGAAGVAYALSPLAPVGITKRAEPEPGFRWEWGIGAFGVAVVLVVTLLAIGGCVIAVRQRAEKLQRAGRFAGPVLSLSGRLALGPGRGAIVGLLIASLGAVGALTLNQAIEHDLTTPAIFGADYDAQVYESVSNDELAVSRELAADPNIEGVGVVWVSQSGTGNDNTVTVAGPDGEADLEPSAIEAVKGDVTHITSEGRAPLLSDEVAIGRAALNELGANIGDVVTVTGARGTEQLSIVGTLVYPGVDAADIGLAVTVEGLDRLVDRGVSRTVVRLKPGADRGAVVEGHPDLDIVPVEPPSEVGNIGELGGLPNRVAQLLALLGIAGLLNAIVVTVSQGRRQVAIHRALGFTSAQVIGAHMMQCLMAVAVGVSVGGLAGFIVGRAIHHELVDDVGLTAETAIPAAVLTVAAVAFLAALAAGAITNALALRHRAGVVLRAE